MRLAGILLAVAAATVQAQTWRSVDVSRQLRDTGDHRVRVHYSVGKFSLRSTSEPVLFNMHLRYDEERSQPLHEYDAESRRAMLGLEGRSVRWARGLDEESMPEMRLSLSAVVPLDLELELGATEARVDAGGLTLNNLSLSTGAANGVLDFSVPNRTRMRRLDLRIGAAGFVITNLGNAKVSAIRVEGGVGSVDLDFGGAITEDVTIDANLALGKLALHVPADVGVRVEVQKLLASFDHPGLTKRGNAYYSGNWDTADIRMRIKAQTVFGAIEIGRDR